MPTLVRVFASVNRQIPQKVVGNTCGAWAQELGFEDAREAGARKPERRKRAGGRRECLGLGLTTQRVTDVCTKQRP